MGDLELGSYPRFPAASKTRGIARAIEVIEWAVAYAEARQAECEAADRPLTASVFKDQATHGRFFADLIRKELP